MLNWEFFLEAQKRGCYTQLWMEVTNILVLIFFIRRGTKHTIYLFVLSLVSLIQSLITQYDDLMSGNWIFGKNVTNITIYVYLMLEVILCLLFIRMNIKARRYKQLLLISSIIFPPIILCCLLFNPTSKHLLSTIENIEGFIIIIPCLYFFYEAVKEHSDGNIFTSPSFWAISGMLIAFTATTPLFLALSYLKQHNWILAKRLYIINNISYSILFIMFSIAIFNDKKRVEKIGLNI